MQSVRREIVTVMFVEIIGVKGPSLYLLDQPQLPKTSVTARVSLALQLGQQLAVYVFWLILRVDMHYARHMPIYLTFVSCYKLSLQGNIESHPSYYPFLAYSNSDRPNVGYNQFKACRWISNFQDTCDQGISKNCAELLRQLFVCLLIHPIRGLAAFIRHNTASIKCMKLA